MGGSLGFLLNSQDKTIEKSVLANQVRPQQASKVFKKVTNVRANSRPEETYPYGFMFSGYTKCAGVKGCLTELYVSQTICDDIFIYNC